MITERHFDTAISDASLTATSVTFLYNGKELTIQGYQCNDRLYTDSLPNGVHYMEIREDCDTDSSLDNLIKIAKGNDLYNDTFKRLCETADEWDIVEWLEDNGALVTEYYYSAKEYILVDYDSSLLLPTSLAEIRRQLGAPNDYELDCTFSYDIARADIIETLRPYLR